MDEEIITFPTYTGEPKLLPPYGLVVLPSSWIDHCDGRWMGAIRQHLSIAVNLAFLSRRLREDNALPPHLAILDNPHRMLKRGMVGGDLRVFEQYYSDTDVTIWGGFNYWFRRHRIKQSKRTGPEGDHLPEWVGPLAFQDSGDAYVFTVAGQYSSCAACNILAYLLGWQGTIFVVGNMARGPYCKLEIPISRPELTRDNEKVMAADNHQWSYLYHGALATGVEIVHVEPSPINTVPVVSELKALEVLDDN